MAARHLRSENAGGDLSHVQAGNPLSDRDSGSATDMTKHRVPPIDDALWYKDAVIYQVHVKSFFDADNDGVGDFKGLLDKLDYIAELGVTAVWLLPFYPSPRRDDGYDISDYRGVHPEYGMLADVRRFIEAAHARGLRVIAELVINHTSDKHPWFERAPLSAKPGSKSAISMSGRTRTTNTPAPGSFLSTPRKAIGPGTKQRRRIVDKFYSHQPDLNFDNPQVLKECSA